MTPSPLELRLLGHPVILLNGHPLENLPSRTAEALLVFLALQPHPVSREFLAELLWSERTQDQALANLRSILSSLRKAVGDYVLATRQNVAFNRALPFLLDVEQFEQTIERLPLQRQTAPLSPETATQLETALAHYRGDFLEGFYLREGRGFEEWAALLRERLRRLAHLGFRARVRHALENGNYREGIQASEKLIAIDPYDEEARRQLMTLLLRNGNRNTALKQYETLRKLLHEDLGVEPAPATRAVYERVRALTFPPPLRPAPRP
ncbi:MAG: hypothetical protein HUU38_28680, partial [Anaerolineales bacterium]|nr:hypothetical protein [Anaerolineales bacterium]